MYSIWKLFIYYSLNYKKKKKTQSTLSMYKIFPSPKKENIGLKVKKFY